MPSSLFYLFHDGQEFLIFKWPLKYLLDGFRRSLTLCGVSAEIQEALESEDQSFYGLGFASETSSDIDADDESDSDTSGEPAKRQYSAGIATRVTAAAGIAQTSSSDDADDERLSTATNLSDGESAAAVSSPTPAEKGGLMASDIVATIRHGCTCKKVNHCLKIICLISPRWNVGKRKCLS